MHKRHSLRKRALPGLLLLAGAALSYASPAGAATVAPGDGRGARTFHVDPANDGDMADGSREHPFRTLDDLSDMRFRPGDSILLSGAGTLEGRIRISGVKATPDAPVVITSYGGGNPLGRIVRHHRRELRAHPHKGRGRERQRPQGGKQGERNRGDRLPARED